MTAAGVELCEDFQGVPCEVAEFQLSESFSEEFSPIQAGVPAVLIYIDDESGDLRWHIFSDEVTSEEVIGVLNTPTPPTEEFVQKLERGGSLILHDPSDDLVILSGVQLTARGLEQTNQE
jgi:hypothetical protein